MAKRGKYTTKFKADCIAFLLGAGYPDNPYKLEEVAKHCKVPSRTLRRWFDGQSGTPSSEIVIESKKDLADIYEDVARKYLIHAVEPDLIDETSGKDSVIAAATATDKMRLLRGLPTEIVEIMPQLVEALRKAGLDPVDTFNRMLQRAHERANQPD